jgi:Carboxypeptidase regulatory-like domain
MSLQNCFRSTTILIVLVVARLAAASQPPAAAQPQPVGSARLTGRVIALDNGTPVRHAYIRLSGLVPSQPNAGPPASVSRNTETDINGDFDFANLPAASYHITVDPVSGFVRPSRSRDAAVAEGQTVQITIRVERTGAIEGRVLDENGDGVLGVQVHPVRRLNIGGYTKIETSGRSATTDDRGTFRIFNVPPGEYYVVATYMPPRRDINPIPRLGYTNTYHPRSLTLDDARSVVVRPGRSTERVDVTLTSRQLVRVSVRAVSSSGVPLDKDARLSLRRRDPVYLETSARFPNLPKDGTFLFDDIMPGDYYLVVSTSHRLEEAAYVNVTVADKDLSLNVQTNTGAKVSGRMFIDGRPVGEDASTGRWNVSVSATRPWGPPRWGIDYAKDLLSQTQGTDRFELVGLRGPMVLDASIGAGTLVSIRRGGREIAGEALDFVGTETFDDIVIEFTMNLAQLDVSVTSTSAVDDPQPVLLILFADDPSLWHHAYVQYARATAARPSARQSDKDNTDSRMTLAPMVPGRYRIIAIHDPDISYPEETAILEKLRPFATPVTLVTGETAKINIGVAKLVR